MRIADRSKMYVAYLRSFLKKNWTVNDYPIRYMQQESSAPNTPARLRVQKWRVDILGWYLAGSGETEEEAYADLRTKFTEAHEQRSSLPRPGTSVPIEFATDEKVSRYPDLRDHFIANVLGLSWAFISDESSLWDFHEDTTNSALQEKIGEVYGVDVTHISSGNIASILSDILIQIGTFPEDPATRAARLDRDARARQLMGLPALHWNEY